MNTPKFSAVLAAVLLATATLSASAASSLVDFSNGTQGWTGVADGRASWIDSTLGNSAPAYRTQIAETFGLTWQTSSNNFLDALAPDKSITIGLDFKALQITYLGDEVSRHVVVELRDYDNTSGGYPWTSVWFDLGTVSSATQGWQHLSVTIDNSSATALPAGWGGYGDDDANGGPVLPAGRSFADVLAHADAVVFTTYVPGYFYGFTNYDVAIDNISISSVTAVPEPSALALSIAGLGLLACRLKRRR